jgi:hypothetical protein
MLLRLLLTVAVVLAESASAAPIIHQHSQADVCTAEAGTCFTGPPLFGSSNFTATTAAQCCLQCRKFSFTTPQTPQPCVNYTFNSTSMFCALFTANQPKMNASECISGSPPAFNITLPCVTDPDCNDGTCTTGVCTCKDGFTGNYCEQGGEVAGNCSVVDNICLSGQEVTTKWTTSLTGPSKNVTSLTECCRLCTLVGQCSNYTYYGPGYVTAPGKWASGPWAGYCSLMTGVATKAVSTKTTPCVSGGSQGHFVLPCQADTDCGGAGGTCAGGKCTCDAGFTGPLCGTCPSAMGSCVLNKGVRMTGRSPIFNPSANHGTAPPLTTPTAEDCCYECTKHSQDTPNPCANFTYNSSSKECSLFPTVGTMAWDADFVSGGPLARGPSEDPSLTNLKAGVCMTGNLLIETTTPTMAGCAGLCATCEY